TFELAGHLGVGRDDLVDGVGDLAVEASPVARQAHREIAVANALRDGEEGREFDAARGLVGRNSRSRRVEAWHASAPKGQERLADPCCVLVRTRGRRRLLVKLTKPVRAQAEQSKKRAQLFRPTIGRFQIPVRLQPRQKTRVTPAELVAGTLTTNTATE